MLIRPVISRMISVDLPVSGTVTMVACFAGIGLGHQDPRALDGKQHSVGRILLIDKTLGRELPGNPYKVVSIMMLAPSTYNFRPEGLSY